MVCKMENFLNLYIVMDHNFSLNKTLKVVFNCLLKVGFHFIVFSMPKWIKVEFFSIKNYLKPLSIFKFIFLTILVIWLMLEKSSIIFCMQLNNFCIYHFQWKYLNIEHATQMGKISIYCFILIFHFVLLIKPEIYFINVKAHE